MTLYGQEVTSLQCWLWSIFADVQIWSSFLFFYLPLWRLLLFREILFLLQIFGILRTFALILLYSSKSLLVSSLITYNTGPKTLHSCTVVFESVEEGKSKKSFHNCAFDSTVLHIVACHDWAYSSPLECFPGSI